MLSGYTNVENKELYHSSSIQCMDSVIKMLKKGYPMYQDKTQYVLWLDFNLFTKYEFTDIDVSIQLLDENRHVLLQLNSLDKTSLMWRTPYPNKHIVQMGMKNGRKVVFGYPILFDTFDKMAKIKFVQIHWTVYKPIYDSQMRNVCELGIDTVLTELETDFITPDSDDMYWYTISRQDVLIDELTSDCISQYHGILSTKSSIVFEKRPFGLEFVDNGCDVYFDWKDNLQSPLYKQHIITLDSYVWSKYRVMDMLKQLNPQNMDVVSYQKVFYSYKQNVYGKIAPDLDISGAFGFE